MRDKVVARFRAASSDDYDMADAMADAYSDAIAAVEPDVDDILKMIKKGVQEGCEAERERSESISGRHAGGATLEWRSVEIKPHGKDTLTVEFPDTLTYSRDSESESGSKATFEIRVRRTDK